MFLYIKKTSNKPLVNMNAKKSELNLINYITIQFNIKWMHLFKDKDNSIRHFINLHLLLHQTI